MAFKFNLEPVMKHRKRLEEMAQREFAEAQQAVEVCLRAIEAMYTRLDEVRDEISQIQLSGQAGAMEHVVSIEQFIKGHKVLIENRRLEARALLVIAEHKQEALIEAARERKILTKLREKRFTEYKEWLNRLEAKAMDDMTMVRHGWGKR